MYKIFVGMIVSCFFSTAVLGMTEQKDVSGDTSLETGVSQLSLDSAAGVKTGDGGVAGDKKAQDITEDSKEALVLPDKETYWDHARLRFFMRGDKKKYIAVFKRAVEEKNVVLQVALANAYAASLWDKDAQKDFSVFDLKNFKNFIFNGFRHGYYDVLYDEAFGATSDFVAHAKCVHQAYQEAAAEKFVPAILTEMMYPGRSGCPKNSNREQLRTLAESKHPEAMLLYGKELFWDYESNPEDKLKGLQYMHASGLLIVKHRPREPWETDEERFKRFCEYYTRNEDQSSWDHYKGMRFFTSNVVLVPHEGYLEKVCESLRVSGASKL